MVKNKKRLVGMTSLLCILKFIFKSKHRPATHCEGMVVVKVYVKKIGHDQSAN
jgi:hypothetical protein